MSMLISVRHDRKNRQTTYVWGWDAPDAVTAGGNPRLHTSSGKLRLGKDDSVPPWNKADGDRNEDQLADERFVGRSLTVSDTVNVVAEKVAKATNGKPAELSMAEMRVLVAEADATERTRNDLATANVENARLKKLLAEKK